MTLTVLNLHQKTYPMGQQDFKGQRHYKVKGQINITLHTEVVIHSMYAYVWCWSKICGSLDEIPSVTMGSCKVKFVTRGSLAKKKDNVFA